MTGTVTQHRRLLLALLYFALPAGLLFGQWETIRGKTMNWLSGSATDPELERPSQPQLARSVSAVPAAPAQGGGGFNITQAVIPGGGGVSAGGGGCAGSRAYTVRILTYTITTVSAACYAPALAPKAIVAGYGLSLANSTVLANSLPLPIVLAGTKVMVRDIFGVERAVPLFFVSPTQINS